jgi:hypothetical protein
MVPKDTARYFIYFPVHYAYHRLIGCAVLLSVIEWIHMHKYGVRVTRESGEEDFEVGTYITLSISTEDKNRINTSSRSGCHILQLYAQRSVTRECIYLSRFLPAKVTRSVYSTPLRLTACHADLCCAVARLTRCAVWILLLAIDSPLERLNLHWFTAVVF